MSNTNTSLIKINYGAQYIPAYLDSRAAEELITEHRPRPEDVVMKSNIINYIENGTPFEQNQAQDYSSVRQRAVYNNKRKYIY